MLAVDSPGAQLTWLDWLRIITSAAKLVASISGLFLLSGATPWQASLIDMFLILMSTLASEKLHSRL